MPHFYRPRSITLTEGLDMLLQFDSNSGCHPPAHKLVCATCIVVWVNRAAMQRFKELEEE